MKVNAARLELWVWRVAPLAVLLAARLYRHYVSGYFNRLWFGDLILAIGWLLGWFLADADHLFYTLLSNPQELTSQRVKRELKGGSLKRLWTLLNDTQEERTKLPIRNILTAFVMTGVGLWAISASTSMLAAGLCLGFAVRLFSELLSDENYGNWYWLFARQFTLSEHRGLLAAWGFVLIWQWWILMRG